MHCFAYKNRQCVPTTYRCSIAVIIATIAAGSVTSIADAFLAPSMVYPGRNAFVSRDRLHDLNQQISLRDEPRSRHQPANCLRAVPPENESKDFSDRDGPGMGPSHSYVEGAVFDDRTAEIEAMGGDPAFLMDDDEDDVDMGMDEDEEPSLASFAGFSGGVMSAMGVDDADADAVEWKATDGKGPAQLKTQEISVEEWDGTEIEDAYFD